MLFFPYVFYVIRSRYSLLWFFPYWKFSCSLFPTASSFLTVKSLPLSTFFYHVVFFVSSFFLLFLFAAVIVFFVLRFLICGLKCCCMKTVYYHIIIGLCSKFISKTALFLLQTSTCNFNSPFTLFQPATIFFLLWSLLFFLRQSSPFSCSSRFIPAFFVFHLQFFFSFCFFRSLLALWVHYSSSQNFQVFVVYIIRLLCVNFFPLYVGKII